MFKEVNRVQEDAWRSRRDIRNPSAVQGGPSGIQGGLWRLKTVCEGQILVYGCLRWSKESTTGSKGAGGTKMIQVQSNEVQLESTEV